MMSGKKGIIKVNK